MSARDILLQNAHIRSEIVSLPDMGTSFEICGITAGAKGELMNTARNEDGSLDWVRYYPMLVIETAHDPETHAPSFTAGDLDTLNALPSHVVTRLADAAERLSGISAVAAEVLEKNSAATESVATDSASPQG